MAKNKFYAIAVGRCPGMYTDWPTAEKQVKGFPGALYKGFATEDEARRWLAEPTRAKSPSAKKRVAEKIAPPVLSDDSVRVYTDGGSRNNPGPGGYGVLIEVDGDRQEISGGFRKTTNNRMEMMAAIVALQELGDCDRPIHLFSDSSYLVNGLAKGWAKGWKKRGWRKSDGSPALNSDLWATLLDLTDKLDVQLHWVRGHAGHEQNERCDQLAVAASKEPGLPPDQPYESGQSLD